MNHNRVAMCDSEPVNTQSTQLSYIQPRTLCEHIRRRKTMWTIIFSTVVVLIISGITFGTIISFKKKENTTETVLTTTAKTAINNNTKWKQNGLTIAGGNAEGNELYQLHFPQGMCIDDDDQGIYIADGLNDRIVKWKSGAINGEVVAGGNGPGKQIYQLDQPSDVIFNKKNDSLIICDNENRRIIRRSRRNRTDQQIIIPNIDCWSVTMDNDECLYVSDSEKTEVRRWREGETNGAIVAGGNGRGDRLDQFNRPFGIFVDQDLSVYVADLGNHRIMKWVKGAKEGIVVAGGNGEGSSFNQLAHPQGVTVDHLGSIYVADTENHRIMRWLKGSQRGSVVVGGNGFGIQSKQFQGPADLSFDHQGNLYVVDWFNHRIQKFDVNAN